MVKVGLKGRHRLTGVSRNGLLTGAASRKAASKKLMGGKAAVGKIRLATKRRVPFTGVSKMAGIRRAPRASMSTAARVAAGMWVHDKFQEGEGDEVEEDEEGWESDSSESAWSGDNGVQIVDYETETHPPRAPKVVLRRARHATKAAPAAFKITLAPGTQQHLKQDAGSYSSNKGAGRSRSNAPAIVLAPTPTMLAARRGNVDGKWLHDMFHNQSQGRGSAGRNSRARGPAGRGGHVRKKSGRTRAAAELSRSLTDRLDMALES